MATPSVRIDTAPIETALAALRGTSQAIEVRDATTCLAAKTAQRDLRNYMKDVHLKLDPFVLAAKRNLESAKDELNRWLTPAQQIDDALAIKVKVFEQRERDKAEAEQRRINEENRIKAQQQADAERKERERVAAEERKRMEKELEAARKAGEINKREMDRLKKEAAQAEERERIRAAEEARITAANVQEVKVAPAIPTVQGVPSRRNYKARVIDMDRVPDKYWIIDEQELNSEARKAKKVGEIIPGVEFYED